MKRITLLILSSAMLLSCSKKPETSQPTPIVQGAKIETVRAKSVDDYYEAVGTVRAKTSSVVAARIMGNIVSLRVREGDRVRAGQTLVEIENRDAGVQIQKAQAGVREGQGAQDEVQRNIRAAESARGAAQANESLASKTFNRYQQLSERQSVSPQEFDEVRTKLEVAKAENERADRMLQAARAKQSQVLARIDQAKADVSNARIYAGYARLASPINGVVVAKQADVGSMATPGAPLLTIENDSNYQLEVSVEESHLNKIHLHDQARVAIEALGDQETTCSVVEIVPAADPNSRSYTVKLSLPNVTGQQLRSGLYGKARFVTGARQVLSIPQKAITQNGQLVSVFVVDHSGTARMRLIKTGAKIGERVEVLSGLNDDEQIVSEISAQIKDGTRVREPQQVAAK
ncbi:MAG TPA: efflux RND transporter periplasmic adaptor subunit [Pyrinomonadaceae bacterium]|nr:efflux RND transporter periplasmic adaptor subunit [Pyrinomonadaceae bacterium]